MSRRAVARSALVSVLATVSHAGWAPVAAQSDGAELVVRVVVVDRGGTETGAGIVVHAADDSVVVATALHVVAGRDPRRVDGTIEVAFRPPEGARDTLPFIAEAVFTDRSLDLALLVVRAESVGRGRFESMMWLGDPAGVAPGSTVRAVGCPREACWGLPAGGQLVRRPLGSAWMFFRAPGVFGGNSGGALLNADGEIVGMVTDVGQEGSGEIARALSIDEVMDGLAVHCALSTPTPDEGVIAADRAQRGRDESGRVLRQPPIPRAGYRSSFGITQLFPTPWGPGERLPSARVMYRGRRGGLVTWHVGLLRLATDSVGFRGAAGGFGLDVPLGRARRIRVEPFVEVGAGAVAVSYDRGGYLSATEGYVGATDVLRATSLGSGAGVSLEWAIPLRLLVGVSVGYWRFTTPELPATATDGALPIGHTDKAPTLHRTFFGISLQRGSLR